MTFDRGEAIRAGIAVLLGVIGVFVALFFLTGRQAHARWSAAYAGSPPEIKQWFSNQRNAHGQSCCADSDGFPFYGAYSMNEDGSVTLQTEAGPRTLPAWMVLKGPNPTGHAVWWHIGATDYCFAPGTLS